MFRDIKRDAFHRSHPLVPAMNASTTPPLPSPVSCLTLPRTRARRCIHMHTPPPPQVAADNHPRELWPTRPELTPLPSPPFDGYTPNLQLSPSHHHEHAIYYTPGDRMRGDRLSVTRLLKDKAASNDLPMSPIYPRMGTVVECTYRAFSFREIGCLMLSVRGSGGAE